MSLNVKDETLIKNLRERFSAKDLFCVLARAMSPEETREAVVAVMDESLLGPDAGIESIVDICLDTKAGKKETDRVTIELFDKVFDRVFDKRSAEFKSNRSFEEACYPSLEDFKDFIENRYVVDDLLETYSDSELISYLEDRSIEFESYLDNFKEEVEDNCIAEYDHKTSLLEDKLMKSSNILEMHPDDAWKWCASQAGSTYYDGDAVERWVEDVTEHISKSSFAQTINRDRENSK